MLIVGVDPGLDGAIAFLAVADGVLRLADMPTLELVRAGKVKREVDAAGLVNLLASARIGHAFVEQIGAMPGQGVSSMFSMGKTYGTILGVLAALGVPVTKVSPVVWKRTLAVPAAKDGARARASEMMPAFAYNWPLVKHHGRAEAALIAEYGRRSFANIAGAA